jgi:hypothetical protein
MRRASSATCLLLAALAALAGCGGGGTSGGDPDAGPRPDGGGGGPGDFRWDTVGYINVVENGVNGASWVWFPLYATIGDRPYPLLQELIASEGECAVYGLPDPGFCDPACGPGTTCDADGACAPLPSSAPAGRITASGLLVELAFVDQGGGYYGVDPEPVTTDLFADDATITFSAEGDVTPAFDVTVGGVAPLVGGPYTISFNEPLDDIDVTWEQAPGGARVQLLLRVGWHGGPIEASMVCESEDDGLITIPATLARQLPRADSFLESHVSSLTRFRRAYHDTAGGPLEIFVGNQLFVNFSHYPEQ